MSDWRDRAACLHRYPDLWFPDESDEATRRYAKAICARCPVSEQCLAEALRLDAREGIWGGAGPVTRKRLARQAS